MALSFDLFGTLVRVEYPPDPAAAVAAALRAAGVDVPDDWARAYRTSHLDAPAGSEISLPAHVSAALQSRGVTASDTAVRRAVLRAFDPDVETRPGAEAAVTAAEAQTAVGLCSNCSVPGLVPRALDRSSLDADAFDAVVVSVECGWRKPDERIFESLATGLDVSPSALVHVGDDPETDGGVEAVGGQYLDVADVSLPDFPEWLEATP